MWKKKEFWAGIGIGAVIFGGIVAIAMPPAETEERVVKLYRLCNEDEGCDFYICDLVEP